jgi:steroid 5-alpha reductase family enzyme
VTAPAFDPALWLAALPVLLALALLGWLLSLAVKNVNLAGALWCLMLFAAGVTYALDSDPRAPRLALVLWLLALWAARLVVYLVTRGAGHGEERRYGDLRTHHQPGFALKSVYLVFVPQALLAWVISLPLLGAFATIRPIGLLDHVGLALWGVGFLFESLADWQLARFRRDPGHAEAVMDRGLWRLTRHPNYFGEACIWWGFWFIALAAGAWWAIPGPLVLSWLVLRASRLRLENDIGKRRPQYADYVLKTNAFFPARRRKST